MNREEAIKAGLKVGLKLYALSYWEYSPREWNTFTIKAMKPKTMTVWSWRYGSISIAYVDFPLLIKGDLEATLFKTKAEVAKDALRKHFDELKERNREMMPLTREIKYLQKMART
jgi:hypothetical protein